MEGAQYRSKTSMANKKRNVESERRIEKMIADPRDIGETKALKKLAFRYEKKKEEEERKGEAPPYE